MTRNILFLLLFTLGFATSLKAQNFSYVYIQGDKKTPIYAKVEGVMIPRYGKNYALIARLAPGPMSIEILFKQNIYPPLQFNLLVPENGKRAFVLTIKEDSFFLFDVAQNFYLPANNSIEEDHLPSAIIADQVNTAQAVIPVDTIEIISKRKQKNKPSVAQKDLVINTVNAASVDSTQPAFIQNITFNNEHQDAAQSDSSLVFHTTHSTQFIINSDCKSLLSQPAFVKLYNALNAKKTEDERLGLLLESLKQNCISVSQAQQLVGVLSSDVARFSALKTVYPKINDQINFPQLASLLQSEEWKAYFDQLIQAK